MQAAHPNYNLIFGVLVLMLVVGILVGFIGHPIMAAFLVFAVAGFKALLVAANFMHLRFEPPFVRVVVLGGLLCVVIVLIGLIPDIVYVYGD